MSRTYIFIPFPFRLSKMMESSEKRAKSNKQQTWDSGEKVGWVGKETSLSLVYINTLLYFSITFFPRQLSTTLRIAVCSVNFPPLSILNFIRPQFCQSSSSQLLHSSFLYSSGELILIRFICITKESSLGSLTWLFNPHLFMGWWFCS